MEDNIVEEYVYFSQELYEQNIKENNFDDKSTDNVGDDR